MMGGTLAKACSQHVHFEEETIAFVAKQILKAIEFFHYKGYYFYFFFIFFLLKINILKGFVHRDLKTANIMLTTEGEVKISIKIKKIYFCRHFSFKIKLKKKVDFGLMTEIPTHSYPIHLKNTFGVSQNSKSNSEIKNQNSETPTKVRSESQNFDNSSSKNQILESPKNLNSESPKSSTTTPEAQNPKSYSRKGSLFSLLTSTLIKRFKTNKI
jgi:serine/threonine protein kinase